MTWIASLLSSASNKIIVALVVVITVMGVYSFIKSIENDKLQTTINTRDEQLKDANVKISDLLVTNKNNADVIESMKMSIKQNEQILVFTRDQIKKESDRLDALLLANKSIKPEDNGLVSKVLKNTITEIQKQRTERTK